VQSGYVFTFARQYDAAHKHAKHLLTKRIV